MVGLGFNRFTYPICWRYNLRTLFVIFTIASLIIFTMFSSSHAVRARRIRMLLDKGAYLEYSQQQKGSLFSRKLASLIFGKECVLPVVGINLGGMYVDVENRKLSVINTETHDEDIAVLTEFPCLRQLDLTGTQITDASMRIVGEISTLEFLTLDHTRISRDGLGYLFGLQELKNLSLVDTNITSNDVLILQSALPECAIQLTGIIRIDGVDDQMRYYNNDKTLLVFPD